VTFPVDLKCCPEVTFRMTLADEFSQCSLVHPWRLPADCGTSRPDDVHNGRRNDHETDPQKSNNALAEVTDVYDSLVSIQALQARDWIRSIPIFTEIVILQNPSIFLGHNTQQFEPARQTHHETKGGTGMKV